MSTMPPISSFGSAPVMTLSSPAARTPSIQSRKSRLAIAHPRRSLLQRRLHFGSVWLKSNGLRKAGVRADLPLELLAERRRVIAEIVLAEIVLAEIVLTPRRALGVLPSPTKPRPAGFGHFKICRKRAGPQPVPCRRGFT